MATISFYNHTRQLFADGEVSVTGLKVALLDNNASFNANNTGFADVSANEVSGNGWTAGGEDLTNATITISSTNEATLDGDDISVEATGGDIGPAEALVIYDADSAGDNLLWFIDFEGTETAGQGTNFNVNWDTNGIARWRAP